MTQEERFAFLCKPLSLFRCIDFAANPRLHLSLRSVAKLQLLQQQFSTCAALGYLKFSDQKKRLTFNCALFQLIDVKIFVKALVIGPELGQVLSLGQKALDLPAMS